MAPEAQIENDLDYNDDESKKMADMYTSVDNNQEATYGNDTQLTNEGEAEGFHGYERIEEILKMIYKDEYDEYLQAFKSESLDDVTIFDDGEFRKAYPENHEYWKKL